MHDQFPEESDIRLGAVIVLTGSRIDAQAITCANYVHQTWPTTGTKLLLALEHMVAIELTCNICNDRVSICNADISSSVSMIGWLGRTETSSNFQSALSFNI